jgi:hypothetical protein
LGKGKKEWGGKGRGKRGSVYSQLGIGVDGDSRHVTKEGFQVSKRGIQGIRVGVSKQRGLSKGLGHALPYIMLIVYILR